MSGESLARAQPQPMRWRFADAVMCFVVSFIAGQIGLIIAIGFGAAVESVPSLIGGLLGTWVGFVVAPWVLSRSRGSGSLARDLGLRFSSWHDVALGLAVGVGTYVIVLDGLYPPFLSLLRHLSGHHVSVGGTAKHLGSLGRGPGFVAFAVAVAIGAPIAEEIFFRGVLLRALVRRVGDGWAAVSCGVLFGLAHATGTEAAALPALMLFGIILSVLAERTRRLGPGIAAHVAFNGITVIALAASR